MAYNPEQKRQGDTEPKSWEKSFKDILFGLVCCSLIFLAEKTIILLISISYHREQFDARIKESKRHVHLLCVLYDASRTMFPMYCKEFHDEDAVICDSLLAAATSLRSIRSINQNVSRTGDRVTEAFGGLAHEITGKHVFNPNAAHSIVTQALERKKSSEALARRIWMSFVIEGREALFLEDMAEVLGAGREPEAEQAFHVLDRDGNGDISLDEMILTVTELGRMRKALHHSLHDVDQAVQVLDNLLLTVAGIVGVLVFVSFVTSGFGTVIAAGATSLFSLSFIFSTTAQEVLGSCVFLFVKHPFDVGDRVDIDNRPYVVERISLLFSVFRCVTDHRITQVPNAILNTLWIDNFTRANAMHEQLTVSVNFDTTLAHVQSLREVMEGFVRDKDNCRDFQPDIDVEVVGVGSETDRLQLRVDIRHKSNWSNETVRASRRSKFMCALVLALRRLHIRGPGDAAAPGPGPGSEGNASAQSINASTKPASDTSSAQLRRSTQDQGQSTAHLMVPDTATSTGFDNNNTTSNNNTNHHHHHNSSSSSTSSASTPGKSSSSSLRRRSQPPARPPTSATVTTDDGFEPDDYQTPATSPERNRHLSLRYSLSNGARVRQSLARGVSTGRRNRASTAAFGGVGSGADVGPGVGAGTGSASQFPYPFSSQGFTYQAYPGPGAVISEGDGEGKGEDEGQGQEGSERPAPAQHWSPVVRQSAYYPYSQEEHGHGQGGQYQAYDEHPQDHEQGQTHTQDHAQHQQVPHELPSGLEDSARDQEHGQNDEPVSPTIPPSPTSKSWKSRAGSDEQGIGKPKGPRSA